MKVYKYRSPYRPIVLNYIPSDIKWLYDYSDIGQWTAKTVYAFDKPLPDSLVKQWDLQTIAT